jgi:hypothetical protein
MGQRGRASRFRGRRIHVSSVGVRLSLCCSTDFLSSFDWRPADATEANPVPAFDFLGFGLRSQRTPTLGWQAD